MSNSFRESQNLLATLLHQIWTSTQFNYGQFILNQIKRHISSHALKLPICYPRLIYDTLSTQKPDLVTPVELVGPSSSLLSLNYKLFKSHHVLDLVAPTSTSQFDGSS